MIGSPPPTYSRYSTTTSVPAGQKRKSKVSEKASPNVKRRRTSSAATTLLSDASGSTSRSQDAHDTQSATENVTSIFVQGSTTSTTPGKRNLRTAKSKPLSANAKFTNRRRSRNSSLAESLKPDSQLVDHHSSNPVDPLTPNMSGLSLSHLPALKSASDENTVEARYQHEPCLHPLFSKYLKCHVCASRNEDNECAFQYARVFDWRTTDSKEDEFICDGPFFETIRDDQPVPNFRRSDEFFNPLDEEVLEFVTKKIARALLPTLERHIQDLEIMYDWLKEEHSLGRTKDLVIKRQSVKDMFLCDVCETGILQGSYFCERCGRIQCPQCFKVLREIANNDETCNLTPEAINKFRSCRPILPKRSRKIIDPSSLQYDIHHPSNFLAYHSYPPTEFKELVYTIQDIVETIEDEQPELNFQTVMEFDSLRPNEVFREAWSSASERGPLVIRSLEIGSEWNLENIGKTFGTTEVNGYNHEGTKKRNMDIFQEVSVDLFFRHFSSDLEHDNAFRIPIEELRIPEGPLREAAYKLLPYPDWTVPTGNSNVLAYLPTNNVQLDLWPRLDMAAQPGNRFTGIPSTFRIQADVHDIVNIPIFTTDAKAEVIWDIFPIQEIPKLRRYLYEQIASEKGCSVDEAEQKFDDPCYTRAYYLSDAQLWELLKIRNMKTLRVIQRKGDAIFIPAGWPKQCRTTSNVINLWSQFISPDTAHCGIQTVDALRQQIRDGDASTVRDISQYKTTLLKALQSCLQYDLPVSHTCVSDNTDRETPSL